MCWGLNQTNVFIKFEHRDCNASWSTALTFFVFCTWLCCGFDNSLVNCAAVHRSDLLSLFGRQHASVMWGGDSELPLCRTNFCRHDSSGVLSSADAVAYEAPITVAAGRWTDRLLHVPSRLTPAMRGPHDSHWCWDFRAPSRTFLLSRFHTFKLFSSEILFGCQCCQKVLIVAVPQDLLLCLFLIFSNTGSDLVCVFVWYRLCFLNGLKSFGCLLLHF